MGVSAIIGTIITAAETAGAAVASAGAAIAGGVTGIAEGLGIPAALAAPLGTGVEFAAGQSALGAGEAALTGGDPAKGAEAGAISGFVGGAGGGFLGDLGVNATLATTAANAAGGALGNAVTGGNPLQGAATGAASGLAASALGGMSGGGAPTSPATSPTAAPAGVTLDPAASGQLTAAPSDALVGQSLPGSQVTGAPTDSGLPGNVGAGASAGAAGSLPGENITATGSAGPPVTSAVDVGPAAGTGGTAVGPTNLSPSITAPSNLTAGQGGGGFLGTLERNPALATAGVGLLGDVIKGNQMAPEQKALEASAKQMGLRGQLDQNYLRSGTLPPAQQAILNAQGEAAKAAINSQYASRGTPGSSANVEDIANEGLRQFGAGGEMAMQLFQSGVQETGMSNEVLMQLLNVQLGQDNDLSNAIGKMSASLASMGQPIQPGAS